MTIQISGSINVGLFCSIFGQCDWVGIMASKSSGINCLSQDRLLEGHILCCSMFSAFLFLSFFRLRSNILPHLPYCGNLHYSIFKKIYLKFNCWRAGAVYIELRFSKSLISSFSVIVYHTYHTVAFSTPVFKKIFQKFNILFESWCSLTYRIEILKIPNILFFQRMSLL